MIKSNARAAVHWSFAGVVAMSLAWTAEAAATPDYPTAIATHLSLSSVPACTICHATNSGGMGTVKKPFGISMMAHGLVAQSDSSLYAALDAIAADGTDSVCDGVSDIDALKAGRDPNVPLADAGGASSGQCAAPSFDSPRYGCGAHIAPKASGSKVPADLLTLFIGGLVLARRRLWRRKPVGRP